MQNRIISKLFLISLLDAISLGLIFPFLPYYIEGFNRSSVITGLIISGYFLMQFVFAPIWGKLSDIFGRKYILACCLVANSLSLLFLSNAGSIGEIIILRILAGCFTAATLPITYATMAEYSKESQRVEKFGILGGAWGLGFILGPVLGSYISNIYDISTSFFIAAIIGIVNAIFSYLFLPSINSHEGKKGKYNLIVLPRVITNDTKLLLLLFFIAAFTLSGLEVVFPLFTKVKFDFNETNIGFLFTLIGIVIAFTQVIVVGKVVNKYGELKTITFAYILMILGYMSLVFSQNIHSLVMAGCILAIGIALNEPTLVALISKRSNLDFGMSLGVTWSLSSMAKVIGSAILGGSYYLSPALPFWVSIIMLLLGAIYINKFLLRSMYRK